MTSAQKWDVFEIAAHFVFGAILLAGVFVLRLSWVTLGSAISAPVAMGGVGCYLLYKGVRLIPEYRERWR